MYPLLFQGSAPRVAPSPPQQPLSGPALRQPALWLGLGGALFVLTYALEIAFGLSYGREHDSADVATMDNVPRCGVNSGAA